ncbi:1628_t:CDS:2, partial [Gigaspora margarita]
MGIIKKKKAITMDSGCKMALSNEQRTEQFRKKENQEEEYSQLKIGTHNINEIKLNEQKLIDLAEYKKKEGKERKKDELIEDQLEEAVNAKWDEISRAIMQATNKNIPYIKVKKMKAHFKKTMPKLEIYKEISCQLANEEIESELQSEYNSQIFLLNMKYETKIPLLKHNWKNKEKRLGKIHKKGKVWAEVEVSDLCKVPDENSNYRSKQLEGSSKRLHILYKALGDVTNITGKGKVNASNKLECLEDIVEIREVKRIKKYKYCEIVVKSWENHLIELIISNEYYRNKLVKYLIENIELENESFTFYINGLLPIQATNEINRITQNTQKQTKSAYILLYQIAKEIFEMIWKPRCTLIAPSNPSRILNEEAVEEDTATNIYSTFKTLAQLYNAQLSERI